MQKGLIWEQFLDFKGSEIIFFLCRPGKFETRDNKGDITGTTGYIKLAN